MKKIAIASAIIALLSTSASAECSKTISKDEVIVAQKIWADGIVDIIVFSN
jgi:hypothetical protein